MPLAPALKRLLLLAAVLLPVLLAPASASALNFKYLLPGVADRPTGALPKAVALTFDDGPDANTLALARYLARENVPACFFFVGTRAAAHPDIVRETASLGFTIGNHSHTHPDLTKLKPDEVTAELSNCNDALIAGGAPPAKYFRPPYGAFNRSVITAAAAQGLTTVLWTVDPFDWTEPGANVTAQRVLSHAAPGSVILLHSNHAQTVEAVPEIVRGLRAQGYTLVSLDEWFSRVLPQMAIAPPPPPPLPPEEASARVAPSAPSKWSPTTAKRSQSGSFNIYSNIADAEALAYSFKGGAAPAATPARVSRDISWRDELPARIEPQYREDFLLNRREFAPPVYPQPTFYLLLSTGELHELDHDLLRDLATAGGVTQALLLSPGDRKLEEMGDFGLPARFIEPGEFDPTAVYDLARDGVSGLLELYAQKKEAIFVLVSADDCADDARRENLRNAAQAFLRFRQLTHNCVYDPAEDITGAWLTGGTLARFTTDGFTLFALTAPEAVRVNLPRTLRKASLLTLMPGGAAQLSPLLQAYLLISPDPSYLLAER